MGLLAQQLLEKLLNAEGCNQDTLVPCLWIHSWRPVTFTVCVDNFGVKYVGEQHVEYLMTVLRNHYTISSDWSGSRYLGLDLDWDYKNARSTSPCYRTSKTHSHGFITLDPTSRNTNLTPTPK